MMPVELIKAIGFKELIIKKSIAYEDGERTNILAQSVTPGGLIQIGADTFYKGDPEIYRHELGHLADYSFCGGFGYEYYDPQYLYINPGGTEYGVGAPKGVFVTDYAVSNMAEDKAETYVGILDGLYPLYFHGRSQVIRKKSDLLLTRLDEEVPGLAQYLAAISSYK